MGTASLWRFDCDLDIGLDPAIACRIGENLVRAVIQAHSHSELLKRIATERTQKFFLTNAAATEIAISDLKAGCAARDYTVTDGLMFGLKFSAWSPHGAVVGFYRIDSSWDGKFQYDIQVYDGVAWDFMDPETDDPPEGFTIPEGCPFEPLEFSRQDFSTEIEWKIYREMKVYMNKWLRIGRRPDEPFGGFWDFNCSAMCFMFVASMEGLPVKEVALFAPGWEDAWHWSAEGNLIRIEVDPAYELYGVCTDPRQQVTNQQIQEALPGAFE